MVDYAELINSGVELKMIAYSSDEIYYNDNVILCTPRYLHEVIHAYPELTLAIFYYEPDAFTVPTYLNIKVGTPEKEFFTNFKPKQK